MSSFNRICSYSSCEAFLRPLVLGIFLFAFPFDASSSLDSMISFPFPTCCNNLAFPFLGSTPLLWADYFPVQGMIRHIFLFPNWLLAPWFDSPYPDCLRMFELWSSASKSTFSNSCSTVSFSFVDSSCFVDEEGLAHLSLWEENTSLCPFLYTSVTSGLGSWIFSIVLLEDPTYVFYFGTLGDWDAAFASCHFRVVSKKASQAIPFSTSW